MSPLSARAPACDPRTVVGVRHAVQMDQAGGLAHPARYRGPKLADARADAK